jgi:hypothetical protein
MPGHNSFCFCHNSTAVIITAALQSQQYRHRSILTLSQSQEPLKAFYQPSITTARTAHQQQRFPLQVPVCPSTTATATITTALLFGFKLPVWEMHLYCICAAVRILTILETSKKQFCLKMTNSIHF